MVAVREDVAHRILRKKLALGLSFTMAFAGPAIAQTDEDASASPQADCSYQGEDFLLSVRNPAPADRQEIMDLIHRYNWALDDGSLVGVDDMFLDNTSLELCNSTQKQVVRKSNKVQTEQYLEALAGEVDHSEGQTRHIESNTLLNAIDADTVEGKSTIVVTIQFRGIETPVLDYTGIMHTLFKRDGGQWKFSTILIIPDGPKISFRAR